MKRSLLALHGVTPSFDLQGYCPTTSRSLTRDEIRAHSPFISVLVQKFGVEDCWSDIYKCIL